MKPEEQIKALAELDGYRQESGHMEYDGTQLPWKLFIDANGEKYNSTDARFSYLTSHDAIIPLIQKQDIPTIARLSLKLSIAQNDTAKAYAWLKATPSQLCESLLRATGKWTA